MKICKFEKTEKMATTTKSKQLGADHADYLGPLFVTAPVVPW